MKLPAVVPTPTEVGHYVLLVLLSSLTLAFVYSQSPRMRDYMRRSGM